MSARLQDDPPDYKIRKVNGRWELSFRDNLPIPHHSFEGALIDLWDLTRLTAIQRATRRGRAAT